MKAYGDIESVNLSTGERGQRVSGNGKSSVQPAGFCTLCSFKITSFDRLTACPRCGTTGKPCGAEDQFTISINYHELRVLCMWSENWADRHGTKETATEEDKRMPDVVKAIAARLRPQLPEGKRSITMRDEFSELADKFPEFETNHPADEGEHPIGKDAQNSDDT